MSFKVGEEVYYCMNLLPKHIVDLEFIKKGKIKTISRGDIYTDKNIFIRTVEEFNIVSEDSIDVVKQSEVKKIFTANEIKALLKEVLIEKERQFEIETENINKFISNVI